MKAIGIVRRIDELGRVVIPKELRRTLKIKEGDPLEIFTQKDGELIFKKYSPISALEDFAGEYVSALSEATGHIAMITDNDTIIAVGGAPKRDYEKRDISAELERVISERQFFMKNVDEIDGIIPIKADDADEYSCQIICSILANGDSLGSVVLVSKKTSTHLGDAEMKAVKVAALFLGKQLEE